jgi:uncharacterized membrane protein YbhN (UPF0104 family)
MGKNIVYIAFALALMLVNWSVETIKWEILIQKVSRINFFSALRIVFAGITVGIITPNRIGEIGGRIMFLKKGERTYGLLATSLGSFAQIITTTINGLAALLLLLLKFPETTGINPLLDKISLVIVFVILIAFIGIYFKSEIIKPFLLKFSFFQSRKEQISFFSETEFSTLLKVLFLSILRYSIFIVQFFLLLTYFNIEISFVQTYISIGLIYLISTIIPTTTLIELGVRGSLAIFFIGMFTPNILGIVLSTFVLWIINLAIPSIFGSFFLLKRA